jgi:ABC-type nitrate/sulfonate/bicarbonate transport system substrate-binding protein
MNLSHPTRRHSLLGAAAAAVALTGLRGAAAAQAPIRQGYQTNMWGMPTYYLMRSGLLQKHGVAFREYTVPSGNITMQQMVARQVDLGTFAGPSLLIGNARGGLVGVALIEYVGKTVRVMGRADLHMTKIEDLRGKKIANQTGSSIANIFVNKIAPAHGLHKGDYEEVRMNVNDMVSAMLAKTVDAMVNVEPYNAIAEDDGIANTIMDFSSVDRLPVFMAATPNFVHAQPGALVSYLKAWLDVAKDFKDAPDKVAEVVGAFYTSKGYRMKPATLKKALSRVQVDPGFPPKATLEPYMREQAEALIAAKKIHAVPAYDSYMLDQFMKKAEA